MPESPAVTVHALSAWRGTAHVLQEMTYTFEGGRLAVVGRNGMGKTTMCEALTGVLNLDSQNRTAGTVRIYDRDASRLRPHQIARLGVGFVPQGRRIFRSLSVDENLHVAHRHGHWTPAAIYELFPRLAERRTIGAGYLSGGEQQMLAIGRALVTQPRLLVMDEPSEGLAPVIVDHLVDACKRLEREGMDLIVVEQNLNVAAQLADEMVVVANGTIAARVSSEEMLSNADLQRRHLGISADSDAVA